MVHYALTTALVIITAVCYSLSETKLNKVPECLGIVSEINKILCSISQVAATRVKRVNRLFFTIGELVNLDTRDFLIASSKHVPCKLHWH